MEQVFVVDRAAWFSGSWPQGFVASNRALESVLAQFAARGRFVDRALAEQDPSQKQLIPYCVVRRPGAVFCVQRRAAQTEARLHHLLSIGIGGHINPGPDRSDAASFFLQALLRELEEEIHGTAESSPQPVFQGLLNDDTTEVGRVHAGLVFAIDWPDPTPASPLPRVREQSKMTGGFRSLAELQPLWQDPARFESWSRILFAAGIAGATPPRLRRHDARPEGAERNPPWQSGT